MRFAFCLVSGVVLLVAALSCSSRENKGERLAKTYCASCHAFPEPAMLDKQTWEQGVMPQMAFRMGLDYWPLSALPEADQDIVRRILPAQPMITVEEWEAIKAYYQKNAPDSLPSANTPQESTLTQFEARTVKLPGRDMPAITAVYFDSASAQAFVSTRFGKFYTCDNRLQVLDSAQTESGASSVLPGENGSLLITTMGIMDPNDQRKGKLSRYNVKTRSYQVLIDSLKRPVNTVPCDLNNDGKEDYVIASFGNFTGELQVFENTGEDKFNSHVLSSLPGSRKVIVKDVNHDGLDDIIALITQGDEQIALYSNQGNFKFKMTRLMRFSPVYGSSYFEVHDFNSDGYFDILCSNGDNGDYSKILKPYHGVRIYLNDGKNQFTEKFFYPMYGGSKAMAVDFDHDGDLDIAAISFFPDFSEHPERGFVYLHNTGTDFKAYTTPLAGDGRWLVMETPDIDHDGYADIVVGALNFDIDVRDHDLEEVWKQKKVSFLVLRNRATATSN